MNQNMISTSNLKFRVFVKVLPIQLLEFDVSSTL